MRRDEIEKHAEAGGYVTVNREGDLYFSVDHRPLIGQRCRLIKLTKSGMVLVEHDGQQITVAPSQVDPV